MPDDEFEPHVVTVQARRPGEDFWMVWVDLALAGSVRSEAELDDLRRGLSVDGTDVRFEPGAEDDLHVHGPLPPGNRRR
jgi:hypothetical protein